MLKSHSLPKKYSRCNQYLWTSPACRPELSPVAVPKGCDRLFGLGDVELRVFFAQNGLASRRTARSASNDNIATANS